MSLLFKAVLGQRVVHPPPKNSNAAKEDEFSAAPMGKQEGKEEDEGIQLRPTIITRSSDGTLQSQGTTVNCGTSPKSAQASSVPPRSLAMAPTHKGTSQHNSSADRIASYLASKEAAQTRTLLMRVETCTIVQDLRDALKELSTCADLPFVMEAKEVSKLAALLRTYPDDADIISPTLHILVNITDVSAMELPSSSPSLDPPEPISAREKRRARDAFLQELVNQISQLLETMRDVTNRSVFWDRFHIVQLLQRLQEFDMPATHRLLLSSHGVGVLVDVLNDKSNDGMLRNEGLILLTALTAMDHELQTILAFENGFDCLFNVIDEEGGADSGGVIVVDCLSIIHNMLRGNKATHKLFCQMGCGGRLCPLLGVAARKLAEWRNTIINTASGDVSTATSGPKTGLLSEQQSTIVLSSIGIVSCLLKESEEHAQQQQQQQQTIAQSGTEVKAAAETALRITQKSLFQCGLLRSLASLALCGYAVDDAIRIAALRVLSTLMHSSTPCVEDFLSTYVDTLISSSSASGEKVPHWKALRTVLEYLFTTEDSTMLGATVQLISALLSVSACHTKLADAVFKGLAPVGSQGPSPAAYAAVPSARRGELLCECGQAFAAALLAPAASVNKYYAAHLLGALLPIARAAEQLLLVPWTPTPRSQAGAQGSLTPPLSSSMTFFDALVSYLLFCVCGGHASQNVNTTVLSAYVRTMFVWLRLSSAAVLRFVSGGSGVGGSSSAPDVGKQALFYFWFDAFLEQAGREGPANVRFWCAALAAHACLLTPAEPHMTEQQQLHVRSSSRAELAERFCARLGGSVFFDNVLFDVSSSTPQWSRPISVAFMAPAPAMYDEEFVGMLKYAVNSFKSLRPSLHAQGNGMPQDPHLQPRLVAPAVVGNGGLSAASAMMNAGNQEAQNVLCVAPHSSMEGQQVPLLKRHHELQAAHSNAPFQNLSADSMKNVTSAAKTEELTMLREMQEQRKTIEQLTLARDALAQELEKLRADCGEEQRAFQREREAHTQALQQQQNAFQQELQKRRESEAAAAVGSSAVEEDLRDSVRLLEEALEAKDEEHEQLVHTLSMMESQLRAQSEHQQQQQQEEVSRRAAASTAAFEKEVAAAAAAAEGTLREIRLELEATKAERAQLLMLVAELDNECESIKMASAGPTPARAIAPVVENTPFASADPFWSLQDDQPPQPHQQGVISHNAQQTVVPHSKEPHQTTSFTIPPAPLQQKETQQQQQQQHLVPQRPEDDMSHSAAASNLQVFDPLSSYTYKGTSFGLSGAAATVAAPLHAATTVHTENDYRTLPVESYKSAAHMNTNDTAVKLFGMTEEMTLPCVECPLLSASQPPHGEEQQHFAENYPLASLQQQHAVQAVEGRRGQSQSDDYNPFAEAMEPLQLHLDFHQHVSASASSSAGTHPLTGRADTQPFVSLDNNIYEKDNAMDPFGDSSKSATMGGVNSVKDHPIHEIQQQSVPFHSLDLPSASESQALAEAECGANPFALAEETTRFTPPMNDDLHTEVVATFGADAGAGGGLDGLLQGFQEPYEEAAENPFACMPEDGNYPADPLADLR